MKRQRDRLIRITDVCEMSGLGRSHIYRRMALETFPKQRSLGPSMARWSWLAVQTWVQLIARGEKDDVIRAWVQQVNRGASPMELPATEPQRVSA